MYRELIAECSKGCDWSKLQPPCPESEIENAEKYIGYPFPQALKDMLRETNGDRWLLHSAQEIIENVRRNRSILAECFDDPEEFRERIDRHIFFAGNGCGDHYCYRVLPDGKTDESAIYIWEHETFERRIVARDIPDLIRKYYNSEV